MNSMKITVESTIQDNVISLKSNYSSNYITFITIPTSVTYLCDECFRDYSKLQSVIIPTTVKYIGKHLINNCTSLTELNYDSDWNDIIVSYDDHLRFKSQKLIFKLIEYTNDDKIKYGNVIPSIVNSLPYLYYNRLNNVYYIPTYITSLSNRIFSKINETFHYFIVY